MKELIPKIESAIWANAIPILIFFLKKNKQLEIYIK